MKLFFFVVCAMMGVGSGIAQNAYDRTVNLRKDTHYFAIPPNSYWYQQPWRDSVYLLPEFSEGRIELKNGYTPTRHLAMNYSPFLGIFVIRQENGDIIPLRYSNEIKYIWLGDRKFVYSSYYGYLEIIMEGRASVAESTYMNAIFEYGNGAKYETSVADNRTAVAKTTRYYYEQRKYFIFSDSLHQHLLRSSPAALPKIFKKEKKTIRDFEKQNNIDYKKKDDLLKIVLFCNREL